MTFSPLALAERVVRAANREHPADAVLRQELKSRGRLAPGEASRVSAAVFAYYRWRSWLNEDRPVQQQIQRASELSARFSKEPLSFADKELMAGAVPTWVHQEIQISASWIRALQREPVLWLRARPGQGSALAKQLPGSSSFDSGPLADILRYNGQIDLFRTKEFHGGEFELQDLSSQAVGLACAPQAGQTWWDACAGEGGKTLHLSDLMQNKGLIWASDRAVWRLKLLKRRAARAGVFNYRTIEWNGGTHLPTKTRFDGVLVDAPCSGTGTWQRNPHARWTASLSDLHELSNIQKQLLLNVAQSVKPGGKLIYAVCTLARSETLDVVKEFERACPDFQRAQFRNPLAPQANPEPQIYLWPQQFESNGMFIAAWRRR